MFYKLESKNNFKENTFMSIEMGCKTKWLHTCIEFRKTFQFIILKFAKYFIFIILKFAMPSLVFFCWNALFGLLVKRMHLLLARGNLPKALVMFFLFTSVYILLILLEKKDTP